MSWQTKRLSDCCLSISDGDHQPPPKSADGIPFVTISDIDSYNQINFSDTLYVPRGYYDTLDSKRQPQQGDILYSVVGSFGKAVYVKGNAPFVFQRHIAILRPRPDVDGRYLYYFMSGKEFFMRADAVAVGTAQRTIGLSTLRQMEIQLPSLPIQRRIADILSDYDELIESNRRQIKLLEEAAQRLYKEWFIDLRFPGHEHTPIIDGVPEGWSKMSLTQMVDVQYGYAFDGMLFNQRAGTPIVRIRNIPEGRTEDYTTETASDEYQVREGDILVGMDGIFHINIWVGPVAYLVQRVCRIRPASSSMLGYIVNAICEPIKFFEKTIVGSTVAHLGKKHVDSIALLAAPDELYTPFDTYYRQIMALKKQNFLLTEARDRLLPKLMSGEIDLSHLPG